MKFFLAFIFCISLSLLSEDQEDHMPMEMDHTMNHAMKHHSTPIGVTGNMHHMGWMFAIKQGSMSMSGNILEGESISVQDILQRPNQVAISPNNLSVIPKEMDMNMTMIEAMYAPSKDLTFMIMGTYLSKDMSLETYSTMMDRDLIGNFNTSTGDLSDVTISALFTVGNFDNSKWHGEISLQQSTGSNNHRGEVLTPMGSYMNMVLPYAMQTSDKATRLVLGVTNTKSINDKTTFSNQIRYKKTISEKDWSYGDQIELNSWLQYQYRPNLSLSTRIKFTNQDSIFGLNSMIVAPVQTANPKNYGGNELHLGLGANYKIDLFSNESEKIAIELFFPLIQDKNNLQMKTNYQLILGYQRSF